METKYLGIILSILGISGLVLALIFMNDAVTPTQFNSLFAGGILGAIAFFAGLWLIPIAHPYDKTVEVQAKNGTGTGITGSQSN